VPKNSQPGEVGYMIGNIKITSNIKIGDTVTLQNTPLQSPSRIQAHLSRVCGFIRLMPEISNTPDALGNMRAESLICSCESIPECFRNIRHQSDKSLQNDGRDELESGRLLERGFLQSDGIANLDIEVI